MTVTSPWTRPTPCTFGNYYVQRRDSCYVASPGLKEFVYSGYQPHAYPWDDYPPLKLLLEAVHDALPGTTFNSLLLNRCKGDNDNAGWHSDDMKLYGLTPEIATVSLGYERDFLLKKKFNQERRNYGEPEISYKWSTDVHQHSFTLEHGSLLLMSGYTQRDWVHSVPKCADAAGSTRISLTFRRVL